MNSETISHYRILRKLGSGGMGEVYLARDTRLDREVALKVLPAHVAQDQDRMQRFSREAKTASALNHPYVAAIYDVGESDGIRFIAMEYVEGQTLASKIGGGPLRIGEAIEICNQIAEALDAAHAKGITHRDIKPENIMLRPDGYIKVLDFGLAKLTERSPAGSDADAPTLASGGTEPGIVMGTVHYMSPEQARGQQLDARTDVFSLGVVLYEMIAGRRPFQGGTPSDVLVSILDRSAPALSEHASAVPAELQRIVSKALRKNRDERYPAVKDLSIDLKNLKQELGSGVRTIPASTVGIEQLARTKNYKVGFAVALAILLAVSGFAYYYSTTTGEAIRSVAVLPFEDAGADPETEYLADGITASIISNLSQVSRLKVMSLSSVSRYKGRKVDPQSVGQELNVQAVLAGRIVSRGDQLNINLELVDVDDNRQLWGGQYNEKLVDVLRLQGEISREVSQKLRLRLSGVEQQQLAKEPTQSAEAYQLYLKGRFNWSKMTEEGLRKSIDYFREALVKDPNYAMAYVGLADVYVVLGAEFMPPNEAMPKAKTYAMTALKLDPTLAEAHSSLGIVKLIYDWDWANAAREFRHNQPLSPQAVDSFSCSLHYADPMGRNSEAIAEIKRALELDPLSFATNVELGCASYYGRMYDESIAHGRETIALYPNNPGGYFVLGRAYGQKKSYPEAIAELTKGRGISGDWPTIVAELGYAYAVSGNKAEARKVLESLTELTTRRYVDPYLMAIVYAGLGENEQSFVWLQKAYDLRSGNLPWLKIEPKWDGLRSDPRFSALLRQVGLTS